ncbi:hypothetical protein HYC85_028769 [Camellia sinensis]|uniref:Uncharacterized protein n=1 Tax=Camellia sinensis TaxID=4442 RepID=A0A7J7FYD8_CAMSI|nr:hypothetical protein HYC85_028769 [Camellia sinensis]
MKKIKRRKEKKSNEKKRKTELAILKTRKGGLGKNAEGEDPQRHEGFRVEEERRGEKKTSHLSQESGCFAAVLQSKIGILEGEVADRPLALADRPLALAGRRIEVAYRPIEVAGRPPAAKLSKTFLFWSRCNLEVHAPAWGPRYSSDSICVTKILTRCQRPRVRHHQSCLGSGTWVRPGKGMPCEASPHTTGHGQRPPAGVLLPSAMYIAGRHCLLPVCWPFVSVMLAMWELKAKGDQIVVRKSRLLIGSTGILQPKWHHPMVTGSPRHSEGGFLSTLGCHQNLDHAKTSLKSFKKSTKRSHSSEDNADPIWTRCGSFLVPTLIAMISSTRVTTDSKEKEKDDSNKIVVSGLSIPGIPDSESEEAEFDSDSTDFVESDSGSLPDSNYWTNSPPPAAKRGRVKENFKAGNPLLLEVEPGFKETTKWELLPPTACPSISQLPYLFQMPRRHELYSSSDKSTENSGSKLTFPFSTKADLLPSTIVAAMGSGLRWDRICRNAHMLLNIDCDPGCRNSRWSSQRYRTVQTEATCGMATVSPNEQKGISSRDVRGRLQFLATLLGSLENLTRTHGIFSTIASDQADIPQALWTRGCRLNRSEDLVNGQPVFYSLPPVIRWRSRRHSVSEQRLPEQWSTPSVNNQAEASVFTTETDIPVSQSEQQNMAGMEDMMRQLQESMRAMQQDAVRLNEFANQQAEIMAQQAELITRLQQQTGAYASH